MAHLVRKQIDIGLALCLHMHNQLLIRIFQNFIDAKGEVERLVFFELQLRGGVQVNVNEIEIFVVVPIHIHEGRLGGFDGQRIVALDSIRVLREGDPLVILFQRQVEAADALLALDHSTGEGWS